MFHVTLFSGTTADAAPAGFTALTLFGGADLRRPTLAAELLHLKDGPRSRRWLQTLLGTDHNLILTLFGATVLRAPTLVEEYAALAALLRTGAVSRQECHELVDRLATAPSQISTYRTLTLFGTCMTRYPSQAKERKALEAAAASGTLPAPVRAALEGLLGSPAPARRRTLSELAMA
jgi:hypothetical protein